MRRVATSLGLIILTVAASAASAVTNLTANTNDQGWRSDGSSLWVGQTTARVGSHTTGIHAGIVIPFWIPDLGGLNVLDAELSVTIPDTTGLTYSTGTANADVYGIRSGTNSTTSASDYTGGTLLVDNWFNISTNLSVGEKITSDANLADWISGQVGTTGGKYIFITVRPDAIDGTYRYANLNTANAANGKPELRLTIGSIAVPSFALAVDAASSAASPDGLTWTNAFKTIQSAVNAASFNATNRNTLLIKGGTYRELVDITKSGTADSPLVFMRASTNERVVISGKKELTNWLPVGGNVYSCADMTTNPVTSLYADNVSLPQARKPNTGWWEPTSISVATNGSVCTTTIIDTQNLQGMTNDLSGAMIEAWNRVSNIFGRFLITSFNPSTGVLVFESPLSGWSDVSKGMYYALMNQSSLMDLPGEWSVVSGSTNVLYLKSLTGSAPSGMESPCLPGPLVKVQNEGHIYFDGLEFTGAGYAWNSTQNSFVDWNAHNLYVRLCKDVSIFNCISYHAENTGVFLASVTNGMVANCIVRANHNGLTLSSSTNIAVQNNDLGYNKEDTLRIYGANISCQIHGNYIHHTATEGHSDAVQIAGTDNVLSTYPMYLDIRNNVVLGAGQSTMTSATMGNIWNNNMYYGCEAGMLKLGHGTSGYHDLIGNTLAFSHYSVLELSWRDYQVRSNLFCTGNASTLYSTGSCTNYFGDWNWFYPAPRETNQSLLACFDPSAGKTVFFKTLSGFKTASGQDTNSVSGDPQFNNAPVGLITIDTDQLEACSESTFVLEGTPRVSVGDIVEYNFDGIARTVTSMPDTRTIVVSPAVSARPYRPHVFLVWGSNTNLTPDLRSPQSAGSTLYIPDYQAGDFNSDGMRDIPPMPSYLE